MIIKAIVTNLDSRKAFDVFNILKNIRIKTVKVCSDGWLRCLLFRIAYSGDVYQNNEVSMVELIANICNKNQKDKFIFFPIEESAMQQIYSLKGQYPDNLLLCLPPNDSFNLSRNKKLFSNFCAQYNFPVPREYDYREIDKKGVLPNSLILKPTIGSGSEGIKYVDSIEQLRALKMLNFEEYIIQEKINQSNPVEAALFLCKEGEIVSYYSHKRIRTSPKKGGVTVFSKCTVNEDILGIGKSVLKKLNWSGFAMIEFMYDSETKSYKIIELNPRIWGSIMLSEYCGANFMQSYIDLCLGKTVSAPLINENTYIRWPFPYDLIDYIRGGFKLDFFWKLNRHNTCFINFSYSTKLRSIIFLITQVFSFKNLKKIINKIF